MKGKRFTAVAVTLALATVAACSSDDDDPDTAPPASEVDSGSEESMPPTDSEPDTTDAVDSDADDREIDPSLEITTISTGPPPGSWDPATTADNAAQDAQWYSYVYDMLLRLNADNELEPALATEWEYDDTSTVLTLTLRDDVTFTDGEAFTAQVAKDNLDRVREGTGSFASLLAGIESIEAPDDTTLVITQEAPNAKIIFGLGSPAAAMVSPASVADGTLAQNPVGTGPYTVESLDAVQGTFVYNEDYWDTETVFPMRRTALSAPDSNARMNAFMSGTVDHVDISQDPPTPDLIAAADAGEIQLSTILSSPSAIGVNNSLPPFDNPLILQAMNYALDRETINQATYNGTCEPASQPFLPGQPGYIEGLDYEYDPDQARALIEESGVDLSEYTITYQGVAGVPTAGIELIQSMLEEVGFQVEIVQSPVQEVFTRFFAGEFQMSALALFLSMPDSSFVTEYLSGDRNPGKSDPELEELVATANAMDPADPDRDAAYEEINRYVFDNPVLIIQCYRPRTFAASLDVVDFDQVPFAQTGGVDFSRLGKTAE